MTFQYLFKQIQDLFKQIQDLSNFYELKPERFTHFLQNKNFIIRLTELPAPENEKQPMTDWFRQKLGLAKSRFLFYSAVLSKIF